MFSFSRFAIKRPVCILICVIALVLFGTSSVMQMDMALMAEMNMPILMIMTRYQGASPEDIDLNVTDVIEDALASVSEVKTMQSRSMENYSMTMLQFDYSVDIDDKYQDVTNALAMVSFMLPSDCDSPTVMEMDINSMMPIMTLAVESTGRSDIRQYIEDEIVPSFERIGGVSDVSVMGGTEKYIQVLLDEQKLGQYSQTLSSVAAAIRSYKYEMTLGDLERGNVDVSIIGSQKFKMYQDVSDVPITLGSGDIIHVYDVADVSKQEKDADSYSRRNGHDVVTLSISKDQSANSVSICSQAEKLVNQLNSENHGLVFTITSNSGADILENIMSVVEALLEGMLISAAVLWIFLGEWKASLIVGLSMPLSVLTTLIIMSFTGMTLNIVSLGGLVLGIGMLVDNSIVVLDSCFQEGRNTDDIEESVIRGTDLVVSSVIASTATTVVVFLPIGMMNGMAGELFRDICFTIVYSLCASMVSAVMLVPLLFVKFKPRERRNNFFGRIIQKLENAYERAIRFLMRKKLLVVVFVCLLLYGTVQLFGMIQMDLMGDMESDTISINVSFKKGLRLDDMDRTVRELETLVAGMPETEEYSVTVGSGSGMSGVIGGGGDGSITVTVHESEKKNIDKIVQRLRDETSDMLDCEVSVSKSSMMSSMAGSDVELDFMGGDYDQLEALSEELEELLRTIPEFDSVSSSVSDGTPRSEVKVDPILAGSVGMTPSAVLSNVKTKLSGTTAATFTEGDTEYDIIVEYPPVRYETMADLMGMLIDTPAGQSVPLTSLATIEYSLAPSAISREDGDYIMTLTCTPKVGLNANELSQKALALVNSHGLPEGVSLKAGGTMEQMMEEFRSILSAMATAIFLVFAVMAIQFESLRFPFVVLLTIPFAFSGSFLSMYLTNSTINMGTLLGMIMLSGIVVNNAIVMIDYANHLRNDEGLGIYDALALAGKSRLRPILMSALTTILSDIPMAIGTGVDIMSGMAIVVMGGLTASTFLTLFLIPTFYLILDGEDRRRRKQLKKERKEAKKQAKLEAKQQKARAAEELKEARRKRSEAKKAKAPAKDEKAPRGVTLAEEASVEAKPEQVKEPVTVGAPAEKTEQPEKPAEKPEEKPAEVTEAPTEPAPEPAAQPETEEVRAEEAAPEAPESVEAEILTDSEARKTFYMTSPKKKPNRIPPRRGNDGDSHRRGK